MSNIREFLIRTPERAVAVIRGNLRDAVIEIHRSLNMVDAVVSAFLSEVNTWSLSASTTR